MRHHELGPEEEPGVENIIINLTKFSIDSYLSKKREVGFILFLDLLLPPLLDAVAHVGLESEAEGHHRVPDAGEEEA